MNSLQCCKKECGYRLLVYKIECCGSGENGLPHQLKSSINPEGERKFYVCDWNYEKLQKTG